MDCSHIQFVDVWMQLEDALRDENGYGGNVAEIYLYLVQRYSPALNNRPKPPEPDSIFYQDWEDYRLEAVITLYDIFRVFAEKRNARILVEYDSADHFVELVWNWDSDEWMRELGHRLHVQVLTKVKS